MAKHFKLLEAVGLVLLLFAWIADWYSVRYWNDVESSYWRFIETFHGATQKADAQIGQRLQFAINRALEGREVNHSRPDAPYVAAWYSAEFRHLWLVSAANSFFRADNTIRQIIEVSEKNGLFVNMDFKKLSSLREEARSSLVPLVDPTQEILANQFPSEQDVSPHDASNIDTKLSAFNSAIAEPINLVGQAIKASKNRRSAVYRVIFAFGSLLLVSAKVCEWVRSLRTA